MEITKQTVIMYALCITDTLWNLREAQTHFQDVVFVWSKKD